MADKKEEAMNAKDVVKKAASESRKIKRADRITLEIVKATKHYKEGQIIAPHRVYAEALIKNKVAKKVTEEK